MSAVPAITLRYFDCRGRVQYMRYYLRYRNISFIDARISLKEGFGAWMQVKPNQELTGPFQKLPVLHWGETLIAESSVIHQWLHKRLGDEARLTELDNLHHAMLVSSCGSEIMIPLGLLLWQEVMYPGSDFGAAAKGVLKRLQDHLTIMEQTLQDWRWWEKLSSRPLMLADCMLWEELSVLQKTFGSHLSLGTWPGLDNFFHNCAAASMFQRMLEEHPGQITGRPSEAEAIERLQALLAQ